MSKFNLEISGKFRSTTEGNVDWFYGGGNEAWPDMATALAGVPEPIRPGKTIAVLENSRIVEYIWNPGAISDGDIIKKTNGAVFESTLDTGLVSTGHLGAITPGATIGDYLGTDLTKFLEDALFPKVAPYMNPAPQLDITGFDSSIVEVGTQYDPNLSITYNLGKLFNGNDVEVGDVSGLMARLDVTEPGGNLVQTTVSDTNPVTPALNLITLSEGDNTWVVSGVNSVGTLTNSDPQNPNYYDSRGGSDQVQVIEDAIAATTIPTVNLTKTARYNAFVYHGTFSTAPTTNADIRANSLYTLTLDENQELSATDITIYPVTDSIVVHTPRNKRVELINKLTGEILLSDYPSWVTIKDASGINDLSYDRHDFYFGGIGFLSETPFSIRIYNYVW